MGALLLLAGALQFVQAQEPQNKIAVSSIKWCNKNYSVQEWQKIKGSELFWQGKCEGGN